MRNVLQRGRICRSEHCWAHLLPSNYRSASCAPGTMTPRKAGVVIKPHCGGVATKAWTPSCANPILTLTPFSKNYLHYFHGTGYHGEPVFYEMPAKTNLKALREGGVGLLLLLRYYSFITEFQWQYLNRDDKASSIFVVDMEGIRLTDFVGETREFVVTAALLSAQHYPERGGKVLLINAPRWFKMIWRLIRPVVAKSTLNKIFILRGEEEIKRKLREYVPLDQIPREYGGTSPIPLGESREEKLLAELVKHNNRLAAQKQAVCSGCTNDLHSADWPCRFCRWTPARRY